MKTNAAPKPQSSLLKTVVRVVTHPAFISTAAATATTLALGVLGLGIGPAARSK